MTVIRTYRCEGCDTVFEATLDSGNDPDPPCPVCDQVLQWVPGMFATKTNVSRAADVAQSMLNEDYGLSDFNVGAREGDVTAKGVAPESTSAREERIRQETETARVLGMSNPPIPPGMENAVKGFWGGSGGGPPAQATQSFMAGARANMAADPGSNPMNMLHEAGKKGLLPNNWKIIARSNS